VRKRVQLEAAPPAPDGVVVCDRLRLAQVLANLVDNAIKFSAPGGVVRVSAGELEGEVRFAVSDQGSGITPEDVAHVFERFWQSPEGAHVGLEHRSDNAPLAQARGSKHARFGKATARRGHQIPALAGAGLPRRTNVSAGARPHRGAGFDRRFTWCLLPPT
jgi:hypothetical protein